MRELMMSTPIAGTGRAMLMLFGVMLTVAAMAAAPPRAIVTGLGELLELDRPMFQTADPNAGQGTEQPAAGQAQQQGAQPAQAGQEASSSAGGQESTAAAGSSSEGAQTEICGIQVGNQYCGRQAGHEGPHQATLKENPRASSSSTDKGTIYLRDGQ